MENVCDSREVLADRVIGHLNKVRDLSSGAAEMVGSKLKRVMTPEIQHTGVEPSAKDSLVMPEYFEILETGLNQIEHEISLIMQYMERVEF